jgi:hypothetical protein
VKSESTTIGVGVEAMICSTASRPDMPGSWTSIVTRSGFNRGSSAIACSALVKTPTTSIEPSCSSTRRRAVTYVRESSQRTIRRRLSPMRALSAAKEGIS